MSLRSVPATAIFLMTVAASRAFALTFGRPVAVDDSRRGSEPGINADSSGRIFINAPNGLLGPSRVWRSTNAGQSFSFVGPGNVGVTPAPAVILGGGDSNVSIDSANSLYFIDLWLGGSSSAVSHDSGTSWSCQPLSG